MASALLRDQVDDREDGDPDDVHEVPVESRDLDLGRVPGVEPAAKIQDEQAEEPDHPAAHVRAVKAGEHEEARAEQVGRQRQPIVHGESVELVDLVQDEVQAEERGREQPEPAPPAVVALDRGEGQDHRQRRQQQHRRALRGQRDVEHVVGAGAGETLALVREVRADQRSEEHAVRAQEDPHPDLPVVEPGIAEVRVMVRVRGGARGVAVGRGGGGGVDVGGDWWAPSGRWYSSMNFVMQNSVSSPPTTICAVLVITPLTMIVTAIVSRSGQYDGGGMWIAAIDSRVGAGGRGTGAPPCPSPCFWSQRSSRPCEVGITAKLYTGGGDGMLHSSVRASHGSGPATTPERWVLNALTMNTEMDSAMMNAPIVDTMFQKFQPRSGA